MPLESNVSSNFSRCSQLTLIRPIQSVLIISPSILQISVVGVIATTYTTILFSDEDISKGATLSAYDLGDLVRVAVGIYNLSVSLFTECGGVRSAGVDLVGFSYAHRTPLYDTRIYLYTFFIVCLSSCF